MTAEETPWEEVKMIPDFLNSNKSLLTVMLQCKNPETAIGRMRNANACGAEAFGLQAECLKREYQNEETYKRIFSEAENKPIYVTNYRYDENTGKTDETLAEEILGLARLNADILDVMGDLFDIQPDQMAVDKTAIKKQEELIKQIHKEKKLVLMSSHVFKFLPFEEVFKIASEQRRRGADIAKIVTAADTEEEEIENLRTTLLLKEKLDFPFLFLSIGTCSLHRRLGGRFGNFMTLCVYEHDAYSTPKQTLLNIAKAVRDEMGF